MSLVESWPSTRHAVERALHAHAEQEIGGLGRERRVGLHEAEHRREGGRDHPGALGLRAQAHGPRRQRDVPARDAWRTRRWCGSPRRTRRPRRAASSAARAGDPGDRAVGVERHADHAGRGDRDRVLAHARGHRRGPLHARRVLEAAPPGRGVRVAAVGDHRADRVEPAALLREQHRRGEHAGAREARGAHRVGGVAHQQPEVEAAARLQAAGDAGGAEAGGQPAVALADVRGRLHPARLERHGGHSSPSLSGAAEHQVEVLDRLRRGALPQVVERRANTISRPAR